jgi:hypothetical protein
MILKQKEVPRDLPHLSPAAETVRRGAQMLKVSLAFDGLLSTGTERQEALSTLRRSPIDYDAQMVAALGDFKLSRGPTELRPVDVRDLCTGMILNENLCSMTGVLVAAKGHEVSPALMKAVRNFVEDGTVKGTVLVTVGTGETWVSKAAGR